MKLLLVRHGETAWNHERRYQGQNDIPLNEVGQAQADAIGRRLANAAIDAVYSSDLRRSWDTACAIQAQRADNLAPLRLEPDPRLRELNFGDWEGLTRDEIAVRFPESLAAWQSTPVTARLPNGESVQEAAVRIRAALAELQTRHADQTVLVVSHGGALQIMCCLFLESSLNLRRRFRFANASLSEVRMGEQGAAIYLLNDTNHLMAERMAPPS